MIIVTGAPRSGTSLVCQVLEALGVEFGGGKLARPNKYNRFGYYEHVDMRHGVTKPWLRRLGADPNGQFPLPRRGWTPDAAQVAEFRADAERALGPADAVKDPKLLLLWPLVREAFPAARWVLVRRDQAAIARSCHRTGFMSCWDSVDGWMRWVADIEGWIEDCAGACDAFEVWPDPHEPGSFRALADWLGLAWDESAVERVLHPDAWTVA